MIFRMISFLVLFATGCLAAPLQGLVKAADTPATVDATRQTPNLAATAIMPVPIYDFAVHSLAFRPDGQMLLAGTGNGLVHSWKTDGWQYQASLGAHKDWAFALAWFPNGQGFASGGGDNLVHLYRVNELLPHSTLRGHTADVHAVVITSDGKSLLSAGDDRQVQLWDLATKTVRATLGEHTRQVPTAAISPNDQAAATGSRDGTINLWNLSDHTLERTLKGHEKDVLSVKFSGDGRRLASASYDQTVRLWNIKSGELELTLIGHTNRVFGVAFSPNDQLLASAGDSSVRIWQLPEGRELRVIRPGATIATGSAGVIGEYISSVAFHPDGEILAAGSTTGTIYIIQVADGAISSTLYPPRPHLPPTGRH